MKKPVDLFPAELAEEYAELGLDKLIDGVSEYYPLLENIATEAPLIKTFVAAVKFPIAVADIILGNKVNAFLFASGLTSEKVKQLRLKLKAADQKKLWERVVFSINAHDEREKSTIVGKLMNALIEDKISLDNFFEMVHATNNIYLAYLAELERVYRTYDTTEIPLGARYSFLSLHLLDSYTQPATYDGGSVTRYQLNQFGWEYVGIVFSNPPSRISGVKVGDEFIVNEINEAGVSSGKSYPTKEVIRRGGYYTEVDVFVLDEQNRLLCDQNSNPLPSASEVVRAGETNSKVASKFTGLHSEVHGTIINAVAYMKLEDSHIFKSAYLFKLAGSIDGNFLNVGEIIEKMVNDPSRFGYKRYLFQVAEQTSKIIAKMKEA